jgi:hypothetical protein
MDSERTFPNHSLFLRPAVLLESSATGAGPLQQVWQLDYSSSVMDRSCHDHREPQACNLDVH